MTCLGGKAKSYSNFVLENNDNGEFIKEDINLIDSVCEDTGNGCEESSQGEATVKAKIIFTNPSKDWTIAISDPPLSVPVYKKQIMAGSNDSYEYELSVTEAGSSKAAVMMAVEGLYTIDTEYTSSDGNANGAMNFGCEITPCQEI